LADGLVLRDVTVRLGRRLAVDRVSFEAGAGQVSAVLGPNGAGKTTLLRAVAGLVACDGEIAAGGAPLAGLSRLERARAIAYVPQGSLLESPLPARAVVEQGRFPHLGSHSAPGAADRRAVDEAMEKADVAAFAERAFTELSFGERRRVLLARALATGAPVVLLDEPGAALDVAYTLRLYRLLRALADEGRCVVAVLHQLGEALRFCDGALLMAGGARVAAGPVTDVVVPELVRQVFGVEMRAGDGVGYRLPEPEETAT
jgi:iron complex transport system ATP-binding protein